MSLKWNRLNVARTALLTILGFGLICLGAFLWHPIAGCVASGISLLVIESLTGPDAASEPADKTSP